MNNKRVSVIMAAYNAERYIAKSIKSVIEQIYDDWELLVIDDCSSDNTFDLINSFTEIDNRIKAVRLSKNSGPAKCRNIGFEKASGRYITILDSDDLWAPNFLNEMVLFMNEGERPFVFSSYKRVSDDLSTDYGDFIVPKKVNLNRLLMSCPISALTMIYDSELLGKEYMDDFDREDVTLWIKLLRKTPYAYGNKEIYAKYRIRYNSRSRNKLGISKQQWRLYREYLGYNFFKCLFYISCWSFLSFKKYFRIYFKQ